MSGHDRSVLYRTRLLQWTHIMRRRRVWRSGVVKGPAAALLEHRKRLPPLLLRVAGGEGKRRVGDLRKAVENSE